MPNIDMLRGKAQAKREKSQNRVSSATLQAVVANFLNDDNTEYVAVEDYMPKYKHSAIVARFRSIIRESNLDEIVYPIEDEGHVFLVKLVSTEA